MALKAKASSSYESEERQRANPQSEAWIVNAKSALGDNTDAKERE